MRINEKYLIILILICLLLVRCAGSEAGKVPRYIESKPSFFDLRWGDWKKNKWIRKPENLLIIHETFKKFGYANLITKDILKDGPPMNVNKPGKDLLDSLELTYDNPHIIAKYYQQFWARRRTEKNEKVVLLIIKDIKLAFKNTLTSNKLLLDANPKLVNDTLLSLLQIEHRPKPITAQGALADIAKLRKLGFHESIYNLLFESSVYNDIQLDKKGLQKTLTPSLGKENYEPWFPDTSP